jgi:dipeptidyl aminopeptidase/acylaminoacyl peptidase
MGSLKLSVMTVREPVAERVDVSAEPLMALRRPLEIVVSPDGRQVATTVSAAFTLKGERAETGIWLAPTDGRGDARQLTRGPGQDALPRWSPSGRELAFASDRDHPGRMSLYLLTEGPGEAEPVGEIAGSVEDVQWAPDGRSLLVLAADVGADRAGAQTATKIVEQGAQEEDPKVTRPARAWRRLYRIDARTGATAEVSPEGLNVWEFDWRGATAVAVCSDEPSESAWYDARLALLDLGARSATTLREPEWQIQGPRLSPDGSRVAFVEGFCSDRGILAGTLHVLDVAGGEARPLAPELDVGMVAWRDDSTLLYAAWRGLGSSVGTIGLDGAVEELLGGDFTLGVRYGPRMAASRDGTTLASILDAPDSPPEVVVLEPDGTRPITDLNGGAAAEIPRPEWERFAWEAEDGLAIEGLLALPPDRGAGALPLVVLVHGGPTSCWTWELAPYRGAPNMLAAAGYAVLLPNPRGSAGRGQEFARANLGDMGGGDLQDLLAGVDALVEAGTVDDARVAIMGGSYGGFMSCWAITQTDRFAAAIPQAVVSNWTSFHLTTNIGQFDVLFLDSDPYDPAGEYPRRSPVMHARRCRTPTLIMHGAEDLCTPLGQAQELYNALVEAGCEVELVVYPREGHGWLEREHQIDSWERTRAWLDRHLGSA